MQVTKSRYLLDLLLDFREEVDEFDVGGEQQLARHERAQVELGVQQLELHDWTKEKKMKIHLIFLIGLFKLHELSL